MTPEELLALIDSVLTGHPDVAEALAHLRLVVRNNPRKQAAQIARRRDIKAALATIDAWRAEAGAALTAVEVELPPGLVPIVVPQARATLDKLETETRITEERLAEWRATDEPPEAWAAKIILRMQWQVEWLHKLAELALLGAPYKRWVSRLDPKTCTYCKGLHGVVVPAEASFASEAARLGFRRIYAGLLMPPLHPNCRCRLEGFTRSQAEAQLSADTSGEGSLVQVDEAQLATV